MKIALTVFIFISTLSLAACTTQQIYRSMQEQSHKNCINLSGPESQDCLKRYDVDYDTYKKQRDEIIGGSKSE